MDETGRNGDTGAAEGGNGVPSRPVNGWGTPWTDDVPPWLLPTDPPRIPEQARPADPPGYATPPPPLRPPATGRPWEPSRAETPWSLNGRPRYADLAPANGHDLADRPATLGDVTRHPPYDDPGRHRPYDAPPPPSAPPYPYEGDLDDVYPTERRTGPAPGERPGGPGSGPGLGSGPGERSTGPIPGERQSGPVPRERPGGPMPGERHSGPVPGGAAPGERSTGPIPGERRSGPIPGERRSGDVGRHAREPGPSPRDAPGGPGTDRGAYDPLTYPRRLPYDAGTPLAPGHVPAPAYPGPGRAPAEPERPVRAAEPPGRALPQRVPAKPDVPTVPEPPSPDTTAETPALARIATHLRRGDVLAPQAPQEVFDVSAILQAVREVDGVRDASVRSTPTGAHSLRLDLAEGADPAEVSRRVARLLQDRMGLDAAMQGGDAAAVAAAAVPAGYPPVPAQPVPAGRAAVTEPVTPAAPRVPQQYPSPDPGGSRAADLRDARPPGGPTPPSAGPPPAAPPSAAASVPVAPDRPWEPAPAPADRPWEPVPAPAADRPWEPAPAADRPVDPAAPPTGRATAPAGPPGALPAVPVPASPAPTSPAPAGGGPAAPPADAAARTVAPADRAASGRTDADRGAPGRTDTRRADTGRGASGHGDTGRTDAPTGAAGRAAPSGGRPAAEARTGGPAAGRAAVTAEGTRPGPPSGAGGEPATAGQDVARPLPPAGDPGPRVVIDRVVVDTYGIEATVEVRLKAGGRTASGVATGPNVDGYLMRLCAMATVAAVDELLAAAPAPDGPTRCFVEHAAAVVFGPLQVAVVVLLLSCGGWVDQLSGSAVVTGDDRQAVVRATLDAVNRRLEALLSR